MSPQSLTHMTSSWHLWCCSNHGIVRHVNRDYKCKRLDCNLNYTGCLKFDHETDIWQNCTDLLDSDVEPIQKKLIEYRTRAEYKSTLANKSDNELIGIQRCLRYNFDQHFIGPIFYSEILSAIKERIKNV